MGNGGFTSPQQQAGATGFSKALDELDEEGGIPARFSRYQNNNRILRERLKKIGFQAYLSEEKQSPIITTFLFPNDHFNFEHFYTFVKERGYVLYPGKFTNEQTFRIGNIGRHFLPRRYRSVMQCYTILYGSGEEMNKVEGIVFDWAGTTVDFGCFAPVNVFIDIFKHAGIEVTMEEAREPMGMLKIDHIRAMLSMPRISTKWEGTRQKAL